MAFNRLFAVGLVLLMVCAGWISLGALGSGVVRSVPGLYLNVNQEVVPPGGSVSVYYNHQQRAPTLQLLRIDPVAFSRDQTEAIQAGVLLEERPPVATTSPAGFNGGTFTFENLQAGLHVVAARLDGDIVAWDTLQVTRLGVVQRSGANQALLWAIRIEDGAPRSNVSVYRNGTLVGRTDADGLLFVPRLSSEERFVAVGADGVALIGASGYWYGSVQSGLRMPIYTDRPLYRPGQVVHLKLLAWKSQGDVYAPGPNSSIALAVSTYHNGREAIVERAALSTNEYGSAAHSLQLGPDAALGHYTIQAQWQGQTFYGSFQVEEYRLPKFKVDVSPSEERVAVGDPVEMLVSARYYYGEPLTDGKVHYEITGSGWGWAPCAWCSYEYDGENAPVHTSGDVELAPDGTALLRYTPTKPGTYFVQVGVTAATGELIDASARLTVAPANRLIGLELSNWVVKPGETNALRVRLTDLDERPLDQGVRLTLIRVDWNSYNGDWTENRNVIQTWDVRTDDGRAFIEFLVPSGGSYRFEAMAQDEQGRTAKSTLWMWASDNNWSWWHGNELELLPERTQYEVGETIRVHVASTRAAPILLTIEGEDVFHARVVRSGQSIAVPAQGRHTPNVHATATQVDASQANSHYYYPSLPTDQVRIDVGPHSRALNVTVEPDREAYSDGETARILIRVTGPDGRPVQAEVSLAMVDEALLSLREQPFQGLLKAIYPDRSSLYPTASWYHQQWSDGRAIAATGGAGGATAALSTAPLYAQMDREALSAGPPSAVKVREYFPETALWLPQLQTDEDGLLRLHAFLPDSLTTWRISVHAAAKNGWVGDNETNLVTRRNIVADVFAPRFLVQGDQSTIQATVANYAGALADFRTLLNASGLQVLDANQRTLTISHGHSDLVSFRVFAQEPGTATITFYTWNGAEQGDAIRIRIPVHPHGIESREAQAGRGSGVVDLAIPPSAARSASRLNVTLSPTIADVLVDALPYLTGFPYGCVEQTLSRFLPTLAVAQAAKEMGLNKSLVDPEIDQQVAVGIERLYGFQHGDGGWGWWTADGRNPYTTTYVVYGLALARDLGYDVDAEVLRRGVDALTSMLAGQRAEAPALHAYALYALAVAKRAPAGDIPAGTSAAELALGAIVAQRGGRTDLARQKADALVAKAVVDGGRHHWVEAPERWGSYGITSDTMLTALALRALVETNTHEAAMHGSARWLLENRVGSHWYTTKDTAEAILSLAAYFRREAQGNETFQVTLTIDGDAQTYTLDPRRLFDGSRSVERIVEPGAHRVQIETTNQRLYWSVAAVYWDGEEPIREKASEFRISRSMRDDEGRPVTRMRVGEEAIVHVEVTPVGEARRYVQIESPLPAGLEVVTQEMPYNRPWWYADANVAHSTGGIACHWCYSWSAAEVHDDRVGYFAWEMQARQTYTFEYRVRAVFPGEYHVMPAQAEEMYDPDVRGHGPEDRLVVEAPAGVQFGRVAIDGARVRGNLHAVGPVGEAVTVIVRNDGGEVGRARHDRQGQDHWSFDVEAPATGDFWIVAEADGSSVKKLIKRTPEPQVFPRQFSQSAERDWASGEPVEVHSGLAQERARPDYGALFVGLEPERIDPPSTTDRRGGIDGFPVVLAATAVMVAAWAHVRRRRT